MEILAPAGSIDALKAAVYSSADAVYFGLNKLNARLKADNFTTQNLAVWVEFCHLYGVKVYLTVNTLIKDGELAIAREIIECAKEAKVDAFIIADLAVYEICKQLAPNIALHASTQMGIHNLLGAKFVESLGFKRVVLSREATLDEITSIKKNTALEVEYFAHGALCVSFSGGCLFSAIASGNSGNRGKCLQFCRKEYSNSLNSKVGYFMSPKDQCLIDKIAELKSAGVDCLKIEGRMRSPEYVGVTVSAYRKAAHAMQLNNDDRYKLSAVFNRGDFTAGYSFDRTREIMFQYVQGHFGAKIGKIIGCIKSGNYNLITMKLQREMPIKFGVKIISDSLEVDGGEIVLNNINGDIAQFLWQTSLPIGAIVRVTLDDSIGIPPQRKLDIVAKYSAVCGERLSIALKYANRVIEKTSDFVCQLAKSQAISHEQIAKQLSKVGETCFNIVEVQGVLDDNLFVPNGVMNDLRRAATDAVQVEIIARYDNTTSNEFKPISMPKCEQISGKILEVNSLPKVLSSEYTYVVNYHNDLSSIMKNALIHNNIYIKLPKIAMNSDCLAIIDALSNLPSNVGLYADNYYVVQLCLELNRPIIYGFGMNIFNSLAAEFFANNYCVSQELSYKEIAVLNGYVYSYGYLPIMTFAHCPYQVVTGRDCANCDYKDFEYLDKYGRDRKSVV